MVKKKFITYLLPVLIALLSFIFYIIIFHPAVKSEDFTTALLVFFSVLGASAITLFHTKETRFLLWIYITMAIFPAVILLFFVKIVPVNNPQHPIILGLVIVGYVYGKLFIGSHYKREINK